MSEQIVAKWLCKGLSDFFCPFVVLHPPTICNQSHDSAMYGACNQNTWLILMSVHCTDVECPVLMLFLATCIFVTSATYHLPMLIKIMTVGSKVMYIEEPHMGYVLYWALVVSGDQFTSCIHVVCTYLSSKDFDISWTWLLNSVLYLLFIVMSVRVTIHVWCGFPETLKS